MTHAYTDAVPIFSPSGEILSPSIDRETWKPIRQERIGSSDVPAILGIDEYRGPWDVWDRIVLGDWGRETESADQRRGNRQEPNAIDRFREVYGLTVVPQTMLAHPKDELLVSDVDGLIHRPAEWPEIIATSELWAYVLTLGGPGALEAKVPRPPTYYEWRDAGTRREHVVQMQHHLMITGLEWGVFLIYNPVYDDVVAFPVVREDAFCRWLFKALRKWRADHVGTRTRPKRPAPAPPKWPSKVPGIAHERTDDAFLDQALLTAIRWYELVEASTAYHDTEKALLAMVTDDDGPHVIGGGVVVKKQSSAQRRNFQRDAFLSRLKLLQMNEDVEGLLALNPQDAEFWSKTNSNEKVEVQVVRPNPMEK